MDKGMPEICFLYDDGTQEIVKLSQDAYDQAKQDAISRGINMYLVIKEMADELRETKKMARC